MSDSEVEHMGDIPIQGLTSSVVKSLDSSDKSVKATPKLESFTQQGSTVALQWSILGTQKYTVRARLNPSAPQTAKILQCQCSCPDGQRRAKQWSSNKSICKHALACLRSVVESDSDSSAKAPAESLLAKRKSSPQAQVSPAKKRALPSKPAAKIVDVPFFLTHVHSDDAENKYGISFEAAFAGEYQRALVTNYMFDLSWFFGKAPHLLSIPLVLAHGMRGESFEEMRAACQVLLPENVKIYKPPLPFAWGTHHTKMAVLLSHRGVRVIITTANYISGDWDRKAQGLWLQDFPLKSGRCPTSSDFEFALIDYVNALKGPAESIAEALQVYDFSQARGILIPSVPGEHSSRSWDQYGHMRVRNVLKEAFEDEKRSFVDAPCIAQFSSMGSLHETYIKNQLLPSFAAARNVQVVNNRVRFKAIWPPVDFVAGTYEGYQAGRSIPCNQRNLKPFLIEGKILHVYEGCNGFERSSPHIKTFTRINQEGLLPWVLMTSSNLSKPAWGDMQRSSSYGRALRIRSYELGILVFPHHICRANTFSLTPQDPQLGLCQSERQSSCKSFVPIDTASKHVADSSVVVAPLPYKVNSRSYKEAPEKEP